MNTTILDIAEEQIQKLGTKFDYKLVLMTNDEENITIRNGEKERMLHANSISLAINLIHEGREGYFYTSNLTSTSIQQLIRNTAETTLMLQPDPSRTLADPSRYYRGDGPDLLNFDKTLSDVSPEEKLKLAINNNKEILNTDKRIISIVSKYNDRAHKAAYRISNGFNGYEESSRCSLTTIVTLQGENGQHPMDGWSETRINFKDLPRTGIAVTGLERAVRKIGQQPILGGKYDMILESPIVSDFLDPILSALSGYSLQHKTSFLADKLGQQVVSPMLTLIDDPLIPGTRGACHFDYDGVATTRRLIFQQGCLQTYFIDTQASHKLGMAPTTQNVHHLILQPGKRNLQEIIKGTSRAILVTDFNGGNCDPSTGNFSYGIEGFLIENGIISQPISGMNITGNMLDVWKNIAEIGNDANPWAIEEIPSIVFNKVSFGGK